MRAHIHDTPAFREHVKMLRETRMKKMPKRRRPNLPAGPEWKRRAVAKIRRADRQGWTQEARLRYYNMSSLLRRRMRQKGFMRQILDFEPVAVAS